MEFIIGHLDVVMFLAVIVLLLRGFPVAFTLAGTGILFALIGAALQVEPHFGDGDLSFLKPYFNRIFGLFDEVNEVLVAVPLFIFMGVMLERSQVAGELLETMGRLFGPLRGGLGLSVTFVGMLLAASTGIVGATVVTMGLISLPTMLKYNYDKGLACGSIAAAGTLGQIIPPSIVLVILGDTISNEYIEARRAVGDFAPDPVSVGDLFVGALIPGLVLVGLYMIYQVIIAIIRPQASPAIPVEEEVTVAEVLRVLIPPILLIVGVLGSILMGYATPTEAAAVGAVGAILLAGARFSKIGPWVQIVATGALISTLFLSANYDLRVELQLGAANDPVVLAERESAIAALDGRIEAAQSQIDIAENSLSGIPAENASARGFWETRLETASADRAAASAERESLLALGRCEAGSAFGDDCYVPVSDDPTDLSMVPFAVIACLLVALGALVSTVQVYFAKTAEGERSVLMDVMQSTTKVTCMVFVILIGATLFNLTFRGLGGEETVEELLAAVPGGAFGAMLAVMLVMFVLGFFLDFLEIVFVVIPIVSPILFKLGLDPIWVAIMMGVNLQTSFLTPPFGFALFYLRGVAPPEVRTIDIYKGVAPFVGIQILMLCLLATFPAMATWLPSVVFQ